MFSLFLSFLPFALVTAITPGPNNFMLAASGANFGYRRTVPHILGVVIGFALLALVVGLGLAGALMRFPLFHTILKYVGAAFLLYLAWRIATAASSSEDGRHRKGRPLTFLEAALFQWVNPKAWIVVVSAIGTYTSVGGDTSVEIGVLIAGFFLAAIFATNLWAGLGVGINQLLGGRPKALRIFNIAMGVLLVATVVPFIA